MVFLDCYPRRLQKLSLYFPLTTLQKMAGLLGVVLLARHGDRTLLPQDPFTYKTGHATLTPLGQVNTLRLNIVAVIT